MFLPNTTFSVHSQSPSSGQPANCASAFTLAAGVRMSPAYRLLATRSASVFVRLKSKGDERGAIFRAFLPPTMRK